MTMTKTLHAGLKEVLESGSFEFNIISYSGRCMYGDKCLAITGDNMDLIRIGFALSRTDEFIDDDFDFPKAKEDSMGRGAVIYWPGIAYDESLACEGSDEEDE
jgi:hypothetical protein